LSPELRGPPRLPSRFATPTGDSQVQRWNKLAQALMVDPEASTEEAA
jgi:hypothetical protein